MENDFLSMILTILAGSAGFAAVGGTIAYWKHRKPVEGLIFGAVLGPVGLFLELLKPFGHRPMVDGPAKNSFQFLVEYQSERVLLQLPGPVLKTSRRRPKPRMRRVS